MAYSHRMGKSQGNLREGKFRAGPDLPLLLIMCAVKGRATGDVFLLPITPRAPFGQASCVPSSVCDPGRDDVGRVKCATVDNHLHKLVKFTEKGP